MHTHERTLIAQLGFADLDRHQPLHDLACQYLATPEASQRLIDQLEINHGPKLCCEDEHTYQEKAIKSRQVDDFAAVQHYRITPENKNHQVLVGFADLVLVVDYTEQYTELFERWRVEDQNSEEDWGPWEAQDDLVASDHLYIGVEIKVKLTSIGEILRHISLLRLYSEFPYWVLVTSYDLTLSERSLLTKRKIHHFRLGTKFEEYVVQRRAEQVANSVEI